MVVTESKKCINPFFCKNNFVGSLFSKTPFFLPNQSYYVFSNLCYCFFQKKRYKVWIYVTVGNIFPF